MAQRASVVLLCGLLGVGPALAGDGQLIFADTFELGDYCAWSTFGQCVDAFSLLFDLLGEHEVCIPQQTVAPGVNTCTSPLCAGNQIGCPLAVTISGVSFTPATGETTVDGNLAPASIDVHSSGDNCILDVDGGTVSGSLQMTLEPICGTAVNRVAGVEAVNVDYDLTASGCISLGGQLASVLPSVQAQVNNVMQDFITAVVASVAGGAALCP